jgi:hypothetical protein
MEAIHSSKTSVHTRYTWRHIPEDGILRSHRRENVKSYIHGYCSSYVVHATFSSAGTVKLFSTSSRSSSTLLQEHHLLLQHVETSYRNMNKMVMVIMMKERMFIGLNNE